MENGGDIYSLSNAAMLRVLESVNRLNNLVSEIRAVNADVRAAGLVDFPDNLKHATGELDNVVRLLEALLKFEWNSRHGLYPQRGGGYGPELHTEASEKKSAEI